jgi:small subunit ribosomal protein S17
MAQRGNRRSETGIVIGDKGDKTITVELRRLVKHPKYGKYLQQTTRCYAHDEENQAKIGDRVEIVESRPISKLKRWRLLNVVERATV